MNRPRLSSPEPLESRIAPAGISVDLTDLVVSADAKTARWTDVDGDKVVLTVTKPFLDRSDFIFLQKATGDIGFQLGRLDLLDDAAGGSSITFKATRNPAVGGDGFVNVGWISAGTSDLAKINVDGDLARLTVGDANFLTPGIGSIVTLGAATRGTYSQEVADGQTTPVVDWEIHGKATSVTVKGDFFANLFVEGLNGAAGLGSLGSVTVTGNIFGSNTATNFGSGLGTGIVYATGPIGTVKIGGEIYGGPAFRAGSVLSDSSIGSVTVGGNLYGGTYDFAGSIYSLGPIGSVTITQGIIGGGSHDNNGSTVRSRVAGAIGSETSLGKIVLGGDLLAGAGNFDGSIFTAPGSAGKIGSVTIKGAIRGRTEFEAGQNGGSISFFNGIYSDSTLGPVVVGSMIGRDPISAAHIVARGVDNPQTAAQALAITSVTVLRGVQNSEILAGFTAGLAPYNPDVQIGTVKVGGDWVASSLVAGTSRGANFFFGDEPETAAIPPTGLSDNAGIHSRIASFTVGGTLVGFEGPNDHFAIQAQEIVAVKVGPTTLKMAPNVGLNAPDDFLMGVTHDVSIREI